MVVGVGASERTDSTASRVLRLGVVRIVRTEVRVCTRRGSTNIPQFAAGSRIFAWSLAPQCEAPDETDHQGANANNRHHHVAIIPQRDRAADHVSTDHDHRKKVAVCLCPPAGNRATYLTSNLVTNPGRTTKGTS
jgi:hypothetical protein